jgi:sugar O-acyltransferase (sialic acid O-acetyltransferase NeuD family)
MAGTTELRFRRFVRQKVVLFGNGQMTSMIYFYLAHDSAFEVVAFTVDGEHIREDTLLGLPVVAFEDVEGRYPPDEYAMSVPISYRRVNQLRAEKYREAKAKGYRLINYISSKATTWPGLIVGDNCLILEGCIVQPFAEVGNNVVMGCGSLVGHHCVIGDHCFLAPGAVTLGNVRVGPYCFLGANSTIRDGITLASECVIGAGVSIGRDTKEKEVYIGSQTVPLAKRSDELRQWLTWLR